MKAGVLTGIGGVENLGYISVETPIPQKDEMLLKVLYCGVNHLDFLIRKGKRPGVPSFPHVLGSEIVGVLPSGEIVAVYPWTFCGLCTQCKSGNEQICDKGGTLGRTRWGGYAEYVVVPKKNIIKIPKGLDLAAVCSIVLTGTTAFHLVRRANIPDKTSVLITGATGGVGTLIVKLLKHKKCTVICATSHKNKIPQLKKLGADYIVSIENMVSEVKTIIPNGVEYVIDIVGGETWSKALQVLGKNGTMVFCSTSKEEMGKVDIGNAFVKQLNILGSYGGNRNDLMEALFHFKKGIFKPVIDFVYPLKEVANAHQKMEKQKLFGKLLLKI